MGCDPLATFAGRWSPLHSHDYQRANNDDASRRATHRRGRTTWDPARHNSSAGVAMTARAAASRNLDHIQRLQRLLAGQTRSPVPQRLQAQPSLPTRRPQYASDRPLRSSSARYTNNAASMEREFDRQRLDCGAGPSQMAIPIVCLLGARLWRVRARGHAGRIFGGADAGNLTGIIERPLPYIDRTQP